ncbi:hypothetical protein SDC9_205468 [bioreactor metagenome]|uniref:Uncharacterized protein n=1 Tax=bioreactor metagenome TaxID=1076179 RepID=A0A645JBL0_9ZZZZ
MAVRLTPGCHAVFAHGCRDVGHQVQVIIQGDDRAFAGQVGDAVSAGDHDVGQLARGQGGGYLGGVVVDHAPVDLDTGVGALQDGGEEVSAVKLGGVVVEVDAHARDRKFLFEVQVGALAGQRAAD